MQRFMSFISHYWTEVVSVITLPTVVILEPSRLDTYAVVGAIFGSLYAVYHCRARNKDFISLSAVWLVSVFVGCVFPGGVLNAARWMGIIPESLDNFMSWHMWAIIGFVFSTSGWWLATKIERVFRSRAAKALRVFQRRGRISRSSLYHERN